MSEIIDLDARRKAAFLKSSHQDEEDYDGIVCPVCRCAWFKVEAVCMDQARSITGWYGTPVCNECGAEVLPPYKPYH